MRVRATRISLRLIGLFVFLSASDIARAESPQDHPSWPRSVAAAVGDVFIRIDGDLLRWTPSGIEYKGTLMAVEGSVFSTVMSYPGAKHLGVSHYIDLPN